MAGPDSVSGLALGADYPSSPFDRDDVINFPSFMVEGDADPLHADLPQIEAQNPSEPLAFSDDTLIAQAGGVFEPTDEDLERQRELERQILANESDEKICEAFFALNLSGRPSESEEDPSPSRALTSTRSKRLSTPTRPPPSRRTPAAFLLTSPERPPQALLPRLDHTDCEDSACSPSGMAAIYANFCFGHARDLLGLSTPDASPCRPSSSRPARSLPSTASSPNSATPSKQRPGPGPLSSHASSTPPRRAPGLSSADWNRLNDSGAPFFSAASGSSGRSLNSGAPLSPGLGLSPIISHTRKTKARTPQFDTAPPSSSPASSPPFDPTAEDDTLVEAGRAVLATAGSSSPGKEEEDLSDLRISLNNSAFEHMGPLRTSSSSLNGGAAKDKEVARTGSMARSLSSKRVLRFHEEGEDAGANKENEPLSRAGSLAAKLGLGLGIAVDLNASPGEDRDDLPTPSIRPTLSFPPPPTAPLPPSTAQHTGGFEESGFVQPPPSAPTPPPIPQPQAHLPPAFETPSRSGTPSRRVRWADDTDASPPRRPLPSDDLASPSPSRPARRFDTTLTQDEDTLGDLGLSDFSAFTEPRRREPYARPSPSYSYGAPRAPSAPAPASAAASLPYSPYAAYPSYPRVGLGLHLPSLSSSGFGPSHSYRPADLAAAAARLSHLGAAAPFSAVLRQMAAARGGAGAPGMSPSPMMNGQPSPGPGAGGGYSPSPYTGSMAMYGPPTTNAQYIRRF